MKICVAVSGGRDSMALLHYLFNHAKEYGITLSALNCDHKMRGDASASDSEFVKKWCTEREIPLIFFEWKHTGAKNESLARFWRLKCYISAAHDYNPSEPKDCSCREFPSAVYAKNGVWNAVDAVATAHHLNDNAETVLFNLARGTALSGMEGITDGSFPAENGKSVKFIRPLVCVSRGEIDEYIKANKIPYVDDESNFTDDYTRNKIRHNVLPELEKAVPAATKAIYRFSRLAAEDESYFDRLIESRALIKNIRFGKQIAFCEEKVVFRRAAVKVIKQYFNRKDYTFEQTERLYDLQFAENGKKFAFLGLIAFKEDGNIAIIEKCLLDEAENGRQFKLHSGENANLYSGEYIRIVDESELEDELNYIEKNRAENPNLPQKIKILKFDYDAIPQTAVIRFMREGDKFTKFGGGTKSLGDYFTDKKIPLRIRKNIPLVADGNEIFAVGGVEISDKIKITKNTKKIFYLVCSDYTA